MIDRVERTAEGINLSFSTMRILTVQRVGRDRLVVLVGPQAKEAVGIERTGPFRAVPLILGDRVLTPVGESQSCELRVTQKDGRLGIDATLWIQRVGGHSGDAGEGQVQFIAAD